MKLSPSKFYTVPEMCALLRVSKQTVWNWASERKFTTYRSGGLKFDADEVNGFIKKSKRASKADLIMESKLKAA